MIEQVNLQMNCFPLNLQPERGVICYLMSKRYFLSNLIVMVLLNLLVKPVWIFLIDRNVQLTVGHEEYGLYSALLSLSVIFNILLDFGITNFNNRSIANDSSQIHLSLPTMMVAKMLFSIVYFSVILLVALLFHYSQRGLYLLFLLGAVQFMNSFVQFLRSNVSANHDFKIDSLLSVLDKVIMIAVCGSLLWVRSARILFVLEWYLYAQLGAYFVTALVSLFIISRRYTRIDFSHFSWPEMKALCRKSLPYALLILLMGVYMRCDSLLLERIDGPQANSVYAEAFRVLDALNMIGFLVAGILLPMFTRLIAQQGSVHELVRTSTNIFFSLSLGIAAHSMVYKHDIMFFLDKHAAIELPDIYQYVILAFPAFCIIYVYSTLLTAKGDIRLLIRIALIACTLSITLNLILIPMLHGLGTAIAAVIVQSTVAFCCVIVSMQRFRLPIEWSRVAKFGLLFFIILLMNLLLQQYGIRLWPSVILNVPAFLLIVYLIRLWDKNTLLSYFGQYKP